MRPLLTPSLLWAMLLALVTVSTVILAWWLGRLYWRRRFARDYVDSGGLVTGFKNPVIAMAGWIRSTGTPIDEEAFRRVAEEVGDSTPEQLENGFIIYGMNEIQRLCEIANVCVYADRKTGLITIVRAVEFHLDSLEIQPAEEGKPIPIVWSKGVTFCGGCKAARHYDWAVCPHCGSTEVTDEPPNG